MQKNGLPDVDGGGIIMEDFEKEKKSNKDGLGADQPIAIRNKPENPHIHQ